RSFLRAPRGLRGSGHFSGECLTEQLKRPPDVSFLGFEIANRQTNHVAAVQFRVGEKDVAGFVDALEHARVQCVEREFVCGEGARLRPETDHAEGYWRHALEIVAGVDPLAKQLREAHMLAQPGADAVGTEVPQNRPELERAEPPPELNAG